MLSMPRLAPLHHKTGRATGTEWIMGVGVVALKPLLSSTSQDDMSSPRGWNNSIALGLSLLNIYMLFLDGPLPLATGGFPPHFTDVSNPVERVVSHPCSPETGPKTESRSRA